MVDGVVDIGGLNGLDIANGLLVICGGSILVEDVCGGGTLEPSMRGGIGDLSDIGGWCDNVEGLIIWCMG